MPQSAYITVNTAIRRQRPEKAALKKIRQEKCVLTLSVFAIALSLVGFSGSGVMYFKGGRQQAQPTSLATASSPIACVACSRFVRVSSEDSNPDPLIPKLSTIWEDGLEMCCAYNSDQMSTLLELTMRRPELPKGPVLEFDPKHFSLSSVSAHKRLYLPPQNTTSLVPVFYEKPVRVMFKPADDYLVEHARGVLVKEEGLEILHSGQYMVYSSINFRPDSSLPCSGFKYKVWGHSIERFKFNDPASISTILKTTHTCCDICTRDDETSFTSGVFDLEAGDTIRAYVSGHRLIYFGKESSFAGLMMLGSETSKN
jgi:hypothetical protein